MPLATGCGSLFTSECVALEAGPSFSLETVFRDHNPWLHLTMRPLNLGGKNGKGWTQRHEMWKQLVRETRPRLALEVGVSLGGTSSTIAKLLQQQIAHEVLGRGLQDADEAGVHRSVLGGLVVLHLLVLVGGVEVLTHPAL